jgi:cytidine kinase
MIHCFTFGVMLDDIVTWRGEVKLAVLGGGGAQTAWGMAAALGDGTGVGLCANVGHDLEAHSLDPLRRAGVNLDGVTYTSLPTPRAWQLIEADGQRQQVWRVPPATLEPQLARDWRHLPAAYTHATAIHYGIHPEAPDLDLARQFRARGAVVSLEAFRAPSQSLSDVELGALLAACDVFSATDYEAAQMVGERDEDMMAARFATCGCRILVLRQGDKGSTVYDFEGGERIIIPSIDTPIVDVTGAGNAYCGAFVATLAQGCQRAASHAAVAASYMVEQYGVPDQRPDLANYQRRLESVLARSQSVKNEGIWTTTASDRNINISQLIPNGRSR